jgi:release factor glutamine methyltransferase
VSTTDTVRANPSPANAGEGQTLAATLADVASKLAAAGIEDPRREARYLICHALGVGPEAPVVAPDRVLQPPERARLDALLARRAEREPLSKIVGMREFWSLPFQVTAATLDPRPDSETVIEAALAAIADRAAPRRILDFGTGSGCLLLALLSELCAARGVGIDISAAALAIAARNAAALGLSERARFVQSDWGHGIAGWFDLIVANPPYVPAAEIAALAPEVAYHEPRAALDGGRDGMDAYRALAPHVERLLAPAGIAIFEIGQQQADGISRILHSSGLVVHSYTYDIAGRVRCVAARRR